MAIEESVLEDHLVALVQQRAQIVAQLNATDGAIQILEALLAKKEDIVADGEAEPHTVSGRGAESGNGVPDTTPVHDA